MTFTSVENRYLELHRLGASIDERGEASAAATVRVSPMIVREARLLDGRRYSEWLEMWADDGVLWVPLEPGTGPAEDQSLFLDDRRRLEERVAWRGQRTAWGQNPPSITVRSVTGIEAWDDPEGVVVVSAVILSETRRGQTQLLAGHQIHQLNADQLIRTKIIQIPHLSVGVLNPSFVL